LKVGDVLELEAQALFDDNSKKRDVKILGHIKDIKIFEATLQFISTEEHIFKLKRPPAVTQKPKEENNNVAAANPEAMAMSLLSTMK
ncbi:MAG: hypothetical protein J1D99_06520, partial [Campylobacter sp.]|nr:hypothetical protein [Campylobacter sp.]